MILSNLTIALAAGALFSAGLATWSQAASHRRIHLVTKPFTTCLIIAVAAADNMLGETLRFCQARKDSGKPLTRSQAVQFQLVEMATEVRLGKTFVEKLIAKIGMLKVSPHGSVCRARSMNWSRVNPN